MAERCEYMGEPCREYIAGLQSKLATAEARLQAADDLADAIDEYVQNDGAYAGGLKTALALYRSGGANSSVRTAEPGMRYCDAEICSNDLRAECDQEPNHSNPHRGWAWVPAGRRTEWPRAGAADMAEGERARPVLNHWSPPGHTVRSLCGAAEPSTTFATVFADITCRECYTRAAAPSPGPRPPKISAEEMAKRAPPPPHTLLNDCGPLAASSGKREHEWAGGRTKFCKVCLRTEEESDEPCRPGGAERAEPERCERCDGLGRIESIDMAGNPCERWCPDCDLPRGGKGSSDG